MRTAIVTGADHGYFPLMHALLTTLTSTRVKPEYRLLVFDFGLMQAEVALVEAMGADVVRPTWWFDIPRHLAAPRYLGYGARPMIPAFFPGFDVYLWMDADISVQDGHFVADFLDAAEEGALASVEETDPSYRVELYALKWRIGNAFRSFGLAGGLKLCLGPQINSGVFALRADAPHWEAWQRNYKRAVKRAGRANLDQHALAATLALDGLSATFLSSTHNWICARSQPVWDEQRQVFCRPSPPFDPISVLHLAGRQKKGLHDIKTLAGGIKSMPLSYAPPSAGSIDVEATHA